MTNSLLTETTALITGGAGGIGYAVAKRFLEEGASVVLADVDQGMSDQAELRLRSEVGNFPGRLASVTMDVTDEASTEAAFDGAEALVGPLNCVVANAGVLFLGHVVDTPVERWRTVIDVNLTGAFITSKVACKRMIAHGGPGRVILTSSLFGVRGGAENGAYSASKWGMLGLAKSLAAEIAPQGITVNSVCPGQIRTAMIEKLSVDRSELRGTTPDEEIARLAATIPLGYLAQPSQVADAFVFLASPLSSYMTGEELVVDGGIRVG